MNYFANFLTLLSLVFGFVSIIFSLESHFTFASWAIMLSVIFDGLDGQVARHNPAPSDFGRELDSLVDVASFGIAPVILGYIFIYQQFYPWATCALFIYLLSSVLRLAKYNITHKEKLNNYFYGLPTTISGGLLASFVLIYRRGKGLSASVHLVFLLIVLLLSFLMVSRIRYLNLDGLKQLFGRRFLLVILSFIALLILAGILNKAGVFTFTLYSLYLL